jgi:DNA-binding PadR family transcriptional regulator
MTFNSVSYVILGFLRDCPRSGYDIKTIVDRSTRFFWAASYGQIYPELKRLAEEGLVEPVDEPSGGRRRTEYRITSTGLAALHEWLATAPRTNELRDEGMLKIFFADELEPAERVALYRSVRAHHEGVLERLRAIEPFARERGGHPYEVLKHGLALHDLAVAWATGLEQRESRS